jgi:hypothetical protein
MTHLFILCNLHPHPPLILTLENLDHIHAQRLVPPIAQLYAILGLMLDHAIVEFVLILEGRLFAQLFQAVLLGLVVARAVHIVFVLFEQAESGAVCGLGAFFVIAPCEGIWGLGVTRVDRLIGGAGGEMIRCKDE